MKRVAVIDIGSNSAKLFVAEGREDRGLWPVHDESDVIRLGEGLGESGLICPEAMERGVAAVSRFAAKTAELGAEKPVCVGTMALRSAGNGVEFTKRVKDACGVDVRIIPGDEEARLSYQAALSCLSFGAAEDLVVFDTGGGSTEFICGHGAAVAKRFSVNVGSVAIAERFFRDDPVEAGAADMACDYIDEILSGAGVNGSPARLVGIGGNVTSMGAVKRKMPKYDRDAIQGSVLSLADVEEQIALYSAMTLDKRRRLPGLPPKRADIILGGACIVRVILRRLNMGELIISDRGLRYGLALELLRNGK